MQAFPGASVSALAFARMVPCGDASVSDPLIRALDHYVVLEPGRPERILTAADTLSWLARHLEALADLPADLAPIAGGEARAERLLDTACELELAPGRTIQWFAVRLEPPE